MEVRARIKALHIWKNRKFLLIVAVEAVLLLIGIMGLFGKDAVYEFDASDTGVNYAGYDGISLAAGSYMVQMHYVTDTDMKNTVEVIAGDVGTESVRMNPVTFFAGWDSTDEELWLLRDTEQLSVRANYSGEGSLAIQGLTIRQTNAMNRIYLFCMICLFALINSIYLYIQYEKKYGITVEKKTVTFLLGVTILFALIPVMFDYVWGGADLGYHLMRVEGIADSIRAGIFPNRIAPEWQQGYGYASPIFYGETFLYLAALFRLIGFSVLTSCRMFLVVVTVATVLIAYVCFEKMFRNPYIGVLCSAVYTLSVYRSYVSYMRTAWGECLAIMLLPIIAYGFYRVFTQDIQEESYKRSWLPLTIGFSLLVQTHLLTCELVGFFTIILCVVLWKKVFRVRTFTVLAKAVIYSILLSAWFLVPFLDYMLTGDFVIHHVSGRTIQSRGGFLAHLLFTFFINGSTIFFDEAGMADSAPVGVGIGLIVALAMFGYLLFSGKAKGLEKSQRTLGVIAAVFGVMAMIMSLHFFPWDKIQSTGSVAATLVSSIQFPSRLLTIANVCLTVVVGVVAKYVTNSGSKRGIGIFMGATVFCLAISGVYFMENIADRQGPLRVYNERGMGTGYISGSEYLPYGANADLFMPHEPVCTGQASVSWYEKKPLGAEVYLKNKGENAEALAFDLLYYKGYHAYSADTGEELPCYAGENFEVTVETPAGFEGIMLVRFESPWYWRASEIGTLVSFVILIWFLIRMRKRSCGVIWE